MAFQIQNAAGSGGSIVISTVLFGELWSFLASPLETLGLEIRSFIPPEPENARPAGDYETRVVYAESLPKPKWEAIPISEVAAIGEDGGNPLNADNSASPIIWKSFLPWGARHWVFPKEIIGAHENFTGGTLLDIERFSWEEIIDGFSLLLERNPATLAPSGVRFLKARAPFPVFLEHL